MEEIVTNHYQSLDPPDESADAEQELPTRPAGADYSSDPSTAEAEQPEAVGSARPAKTKKPLFSVGKSIKPDVVMAFSRQLSSFLEAGISVLDGLEIVGQQTASPQMRIVINDVRASIQRGTSFAAAIDAHPEVFPAF
jgi:type IV pilus assembly protein PilC